MSGSTVGAATFVGFDGSLEEILAFLAENGFSLVEIKCEEPLFNPAKVSGVKLRGIRELAESMSLKLALHAPHI
ncbi:MAG: hypothetical protein KIH01_05635 [Candidatus Freyarchaeota archaeon]|nr:hypothetical protein [Candidatus Jordarchaeia archaeon]